MPTSPSLERQQMSKSCRVNKDNDLQNVHVVGSKSGGSTTEIKNRVAFQVKALKRSFYHSKTAIRAYTRLHRILSKPIISRSATESAFARHILQYERHFGMTKQDHASGETISIQECIDHINQDAFPPVWKGSAQGGAPPRPTRLGLTPKSRR